MNRWQDTGWKDSMAVRLDFSNAMADFIGEHGFTGQEIEELAPRARDISGQIKSRVESGELGFYNLPYDTEAVEAVTRTVASAKDACDDLVVLGIGGSALGTTALFRALCPPTHNLLSKEQRNGLPRVFVLDNIDPDTIKSVLDIIDPAKTIFNVITKSGGTSETLSQFLIARDLMHERIGREASASHFVVTTGPMGQLREFSQQEGYQLLTVPENVGGRFSVLTPVGLFPAAMFGVDIREFLAGAAYMEQRCRTDELMKNPAYLSAVLHYLAFTRKGMNMAVMMPYSDVLYQVAFWFRQLWAESLGKAIDLNGNTLNTGQTPVVALGVTDQHSQLQLYQEGPFDKIFTFLNVEKTAETLEIPGVDEKWSSMSFLGGHSMAELLKIEALSTQLALTRAGRCNISLNIPEVNAFTIGQIFFLLELETVFAGALYNVNPLDQPGVETGKQYASGMMGLDKYSDKAEEVREWQARERPWVI